jgi:hypothetical protein
MTDRGHLAEFYHIYYHDGRLMASIDIQKTDLYLNLTFGLSLFFEYCCVFNQFDKINFKVSLSKTYLTEMRNLEYYFSMKSVLIDLVEDLGNVEFVDDLPYDCLIPGELLELCIEIYQNIIHEELCEPKEIFYPKNDSESPIIKGEYLVLNTKIVVSQGVELWEKNKNILYKTSIERNIPIVLIG